MNVDTFEKLLTMALLQKANLTNYKNAVGATDAEILAVTQAAENLQYIKDYLQTVEADKKTLTGIKNAMFNGEVMTAFAGFPAFDPPHPMVAGLKEEFQKRNRKYQDADGYTREIGIALGIVEDVPSISPDSYKLTIDITPAVAGNYEAAIVFGGRGKSTFWRVYERKLNQPTAIEIKSGAGKGATIKITPTTPGQPERVELYAQAFKDDEPYGQPSDPQYVTFNP
jgi:hypothetical protein